MNIKKIKELVDLMNENDLTEIEIEHEGTKIKLVKHTNGSIEQTITPVAERKQPAAFQQAPPKETETPKNIKEIKAPMVGTFYRSPSPDSDAFVEVGDVIKKGDVLCIVEAMKLMNEVKSELAGKIVEISVENAAPVEFGQVMFLLEAV